MDENEDLRLFNSIIFGRDEKHLPFSVLHSRYLHAKIEKLEEMIRSLKQSICDHARMCSRCPLPSPVKYSTPNEKKRKMTQRLPEEDKAWGQKRTRVLDSSSSSEEETLKECVTPPNYWNPGWVSPPKK